MQNVEQRVRWFAESRYGLFIHFGLYSLLERGEWALNREQIPLDEYRRLAERFTVENFDADNICRLAVEAGMKYLVFTTMHHDGFRLYDSDLSDFTTVKTASGRDLTAEIIDGCRRHGLRVGLYHSLNNWMDSPDGADALEDEKAYETYIANTFARIRELVTRYNPIDMLWYDGSWPFDGKGWQGEAMNEMVSSIQPEIVFNCRNGLPGDFATPEQHVSAPDPWRMWEACMTLNDHWGYHRGDDNWKSPYEVVRMLTVAANGQGNLLLNIGPRGDGSVPEASRDILLKVGDWIRNGGGAEALWGTDKFTYDYFEREGHRSDWDHSGIYTAKGDSMFSILRYFPGPEYIITGMEKTRVLRVSVSGSPLEFSQEGGKVRVALPAELESRFCPVIRFDCADKPYIYGTGGMRVPRVKHPPYNA